MTTCCRIASILIILLNVHYHIRLVKAQQDARHAYGLDPPAYSAYHGDPRFRHFNEQQVNLPYFNYYYVPPALPLPFEPLIKLPANTAYHSNDYRSQQYPTVSQGSPQQPVQQHASLPLVQYNYRQQGQRRKTPHIIQQQRQQGNFYRQADVPRNSAAVAAVATPVTHAVVHQRLQRKHDFDHHNATGVDAAAGYVFFEHKVLHVTTTPATLEQSRSNNERDYRRRRSFPNGEKQLNRELVKQAIPRTHTISNDKKVKETPNQTVLKEIGKKSIESTDVKRNHEPKTFRKEGFAMNTTVKESAQMLPSQRQIQSFHDIFMRFDGPQSITYGHVERRPQLLAKRFETVRKGNRFRGEVTWADPRTGGYGTQHWDLAQGKL